MRPCRSSSRGSVGAVRDDLVALGVAPRERFVVIRLGIELDERVTPMLDGRAESRRYLGIPGDRFTVGWIGRMTAVKRTDDVLIAFKSLRDSGVEAIGLAQRGDARGAGRGQRVRRHLRLRRLFLFALEAEISCGLLHGLDVDQARAPADAGLPSSSFTPWVGRRLTSPRPSLGHSIPVRTLASSAAR